MRRQFNVKHRPAGPCGLVGRKAVFSFADINPGFLGHLCPLLGWGTYRTAYVGHIRLMRG